MKSTPDLTAVMAKLEELEDEEMAVALLKEFNDKTSRFGLLMRNLDPDLEHDEWKRECDMAQQEVDIVVAKIMAL